MTEARQVHSVARRYLGPYGRYERCDNRLCAGWPDTYALLRGVSSWIEEKVVAPSGRCPDHFTLEQLMWGEAEVAAGGRWHLLALRTWPGAEWWLMTAVQARAWYDGEVAAPLVRTKGRFPLREVLDALAPLPLRAPGYVRLTLNERV